LSEFTLAAEEHEATLLKVRPLLDALAAKVESQQAFAETAVQLIAQVITSPSLEPMERKPLTMLTDLCEDPRKDKRGSVRLMQPSARRTTEQMSVADAEPAADSQRSGAQGAAAKQATRYRVFTRVHDWVGHARELCTASELQQLRRLLDQKLAGHAGDAQRWAHRLQRLLLAQRLSSWQFDLEEGVLDTARLTRVVTSPTEPLSFMQETESPFVDTAVTILVDNSGSMRGQSIESAAVCADLLGAVLERCGVKCEILGFTTRSWRGGQVRREWMNAGQPPQPGRIAELCHVIYKAMDEPWRRARQSLGVMFKPDLLKDNIDGEALLWAYERLLARPEPRRILLVVSDGAPLDEATLEANEHAYLDRHLREVIARIVRGGAVELHAIGIGHDVTDYYPSAMMIRGPEELGRALFMRLAELLERHAVRPTRARRVCPQRLVRHSMM
jgi:cobaltochelatase CobT